MYISALHLPVDAFYRFTNFKCHQPLQQSAGNVPQSRLSRFYSRSLPAKNAKSRPTVCTVRGGSLILIVHKLSPGSPLREKELTEITAPGLRCQGVTQGDRLKAED